MATRTVTTKFAAELDASYKAAMDEMKRGNSVLNSEMKKLDAQYKGNRESVEYLTQKLDIQQRQMYGQEEIVAKLRETYEKLAATEGESAEITQDYAAKLNNAEAKLYGMQQATDETSEALEKAKNPVEELKDQAQGLGDVIGGVGDKFGIKLPDSVTKFLNGIERVNPALGIVAGGFGALTASIEKAESKLKKLTEEASKWADGVLTESTNFGIPLETLQAWEYFAELIDVSKDTMESGVVKITKALGEAKKGSGDAADAFHDLGINIYDSNGELRDAYDVILDVFDALGQMQDGTERDLTAMTLLGKSASDFTGAINAGRDGIEAYTEEAKRMGYVQSTENVKALGAVDDAQQRLLRTQEAVSRQISAEYAPYMEKALGSTRDMIQRIGDALVQSGAVDSLGSILESAAGLLEPLGQLVAAVLPALQLALKPIAVTLGLVADAVNAIVGAAEFLVTGNGTRFLTAMGWNNSKASYTDMALHGASYKTNDYWAQNGFTYDKETNQYYSTGGYEQLQWEREIKAQDERNRQRGYYHAAGTDFFPGGETWVGENGPERVRLPRGSQIDNAQESRRSGDVYIENVTIEARTVQEFNDVVELFRSFGVRARMKGVLA